MSDTKRPTREEIAQLLARMRTAHGVLAKAYPISADIMRDAIAMLDSLTASGAGDRSESFGVLQRSERLGAPNTANAITDEQWANMTDEEIALRGLRLAPAPTEQRMREILAEEMRRQGFHNYADDALAEPLSGFSRASLSAMLRVASGAERESVIEECAKVADGSRVHERYFTWPWWNGGNRDHKEFVVEHSHAIAAAIRSLSPATRK